MRIKNLLAIFTPGAEARARIRPKKDNIFKGLQQIPVLIS